MSAVLQEVNAGIAAAPVIAKPATSEPDASAEHAHQHRDSLDAQEAAKARNALFAKMFADRAAATKREADEEAMCRRWNLHWDAKAKTCRGGH